MSERIIFQDTTIGIGRCMDGPGYCVIGYIIVCLLIHKNAIITIGKTRITASSSAGRPPISKSVSCCKSGPADIITIVQLACNSGTTKNYTIVYITDIITVDLIAKTRPGNTCNIG